MFRTILPEKNRIINKLKELDGFQNFFRRIKEEVYGEEVNSRNITKLTT